MKELYYLTNMTSVWEVAYTIFGNKKSRYFTKHDRALQFAKNISRYNGISSVLVTLDNKFYCKCK